MQRLETHRLKLLPYTLAIKKVTLSERARLTQMLGVAIPDAWPGVDLLEALPLFIEAMEKDPLGLVWDGIILHKADQVAIGGIGFHGPPDEAGRVEIGYNIIPDRKSTRLNSSHPSISYAVFCLKKKKKTTMTFI